MQNSAVETRRAFGILFIAVSISVGVASFLSEIAYIIATFPLYYYAIIWIVSFGAVFGASSTHLRKAVPAILGRMKTSTGWPASAKALNGICWAGPFAAIAGFSIVIPVPYPSRHRSWQLVDIFYDQEV